MKKVGFLTTDNLDGYRIDDDLAVRPLNGFGIEVESVSWHAERDWNDFDMVVIRTTWDYHHQPDKFLDVLECIDASGACLENSLSLVKWNIEKTYLNDLAARGVATVPTIFGGYPITPDLIAEWKITLDTERLVIKPAISATAHNTFLIENFVESLKVFDNLNYLVQPLMNRIMTEGEYSIFHFNGEFSHSVLKMPKPGDFRVQEDFGGRNAAALPDDTIIGFSTKVVEFFDRAPLYARVDAVRDNENELAVMELELIEPALYFRYDKGSASRFAASLNARMNEL